MLSHSLPLQLPLQIFSTMLRASAFLLLAIACITMPPATAAHGQGHRRELNGLDEVFKFAGTAFKVINKAEDLLVAADGIQLSLTSDQCTIEGLEVRATNGSEPRQGKRQGNKRITTS